ncbi:MAG: deoxyribodipyrimidine photolyase [Candidatus Acidiferrum sp.]
MHQVAAIRVRDCNDAPVRKSHYVLYWMIAARRVTFNFGLDRAFEYCRDLGKPLVILEALRCGYTWASDRVHRFVLDGMADNAAACKKAGVLYLGYVEPAAGAGRGLLEALARDACVVVTDDYPCFFLPRMVAAAAKKLAVKLEAVDSNGMLPLRAASQVFSTAYSFRRFLQKTLPANLAEAPSASPFARLDLPGAPPIAKSLSQRWFTADSNLLSGEIGLLEKLPIDHKVGPAAICGGTLAARKRLKEFLAAGFEDYSEKRNQPELDVASGLSPYLHFGHISVHEIFREVVQQEQWKPGKLSVRTDGGRAGWWNMSANAENFLDELITWREVGYNFCAQTDMYGRYESLPAWALKTLKQHARDERQHLYTLDEFEEAKTYDPLWNAAQTQLVREGRIHNYLRMLWGKKILEWSRSPKDALDVMIHLNNKYGLDGRDPNSYSGIFWCLGRYDRPWGPERPIYGQVRYMSSENTARKVSVRNYIRKYTPGTAGFPSPALSLFS